MPTFVLFVNQSYLILLLFCGVYRADNFVVFRFDFYKRRVRARKTSSAQNFRKFRSGGGKRGKAEIRRNAFYRVRRSERA